MEATTATRIVSHEVDLAATRSGHWKSRTERKILEALRKAKVREDRHMTRERVARETGAHGRGHSSVYQELSRLASAALISERVDRQTGETTYHFVEPIEPYTDPGLFERMVQARIATTAKAEGPYKCPYCPAETPTERGRNIHIGLVHPGKDLVGRPAQASYSAPKTPSAPAEDEEEEEDDDEVLDVTDGSGVSSIAGLHKQLMKDAEKHGWTIEVLQASKKFAEVGEIRFLYNANLKAAS